MKKQPESLCFQCGSALIKLDVSVTFVQHTQSAITTTTFRCSNIDCQEKIDKKMAEMTAQRLDREKRELAKAVVVAENRAKAREAKLLAESDKKMSLAR